MGERERGKRKEIRRERMERGRLSSSRLFSRRKNFRRERGKERKEAREGIPVERENVGERERENSSPDGNYFRCEKREGEKQKKKKREACNGNDFRHARERIGGKKSPLLPYVCMHVRGKEGEKRVREREEGMRKIAGEEENGERGKEEERKRREKEGGRENDSLFSLFLFSIFPLF